MLGVLSAAENGGPLSQRKLAAELDVALGLVNAYVKRCVRKGYLKLSQAPARRYAYYLTPQGFSEKARLTGQYLSDSLKTFRTAREKYVELFAEAKGRGWTRVVLLGSSDLSEIAVLSALEQDIAIVGIVQPDSPTKALVGVPVVSGLEQLAGDVDGLIVTDLRSDRAWLDSIVRSAGSHKVLSIDLFRR